MRRSREEIIADILEAVDNDINRISSIMRNVNLSASLAKKYLK
ncbi:MAG: winged helix-turn-helix domain-containing protein, partial [Saccharolobus sp.]